nr:MAG TPA: hypothetical protein [Caudoviricetes sp.]
MLQNAHKERQPPPFSSSFLYTRTPTYTHVRTRTHIHARARVRVRACVLSAAGLYRANRGFGVVFMYRISLNINYLRVPFGAVFAGCVDS